MMHFSCISASIPRKRCRLLADKRTRLRAYLGYSGWSAGQLENELDSGTWIVASPPADLFERPMQDSLWRSLLADEGDEWKLFVDEPEETGKN
jgi:putative transcriptional regulator